MKLDFTEINGRQIQVTDMEFLYSYKNDRGEKIAVFEFEGQQIEKIINEQVS